MASSLATWLKNPVVVGLTSVSIATMSSLGVVQYTTGNTYQEGTAEFTSQSGATVTAGGGRFTATAVNGFPCLVDPVTNQRYNCRQSVIFSATGACVAAGCTGASGKSYHVGSITKPFTGSGVIKEVLVSCDNEAPVSTLYSAQVATASTISGTNLFGVKTIGSGSSVVHNTGSWLWAEGTPDVRFFAGRRLNSSTQCAATVISDEMYNP